MLFTALFNAVCLFNAYLFSQNFLADAFCLMLCLLVIDT